MQHERLGKHTGQVIGWCWSGSERGYHSAKSERVPKNEREKDELAGHARGWSKVGKGCLAACSEGWCTESWGIESWASHWPRLGGSGCTRGGVWAGLAGWTELRGWAGLTTWGLRDPMG